MRILVLVLTTLLASPLAAAPAKSQLQQFIDGVSSLAADFEQVQLDEQGAVLQSSSGRMWLQRAAPGAGVGRFRWSYEEPYQQLIVCDGKTVWLYDADLAQVTLRDARQALQGTPAQLLAQGAALTEQFHVEDAGQEGKMARLRLVPRAEDSDFQAVELGLQDGVPVRMRFHDQLGGSTEVRFTRLRKNAVINPELFRFTPPAGTEVIDGTAAGAAPP